MPLPFSTSCEHKVRRIKKEVARSDRGSAEGRRVFVRYTGVTTLGTVSLEAFAEWEEILDVARDLGRGWSLDIALRRGAMSSKADIV